MGKDYIHPHTGKTFKFVKVLRVADEYWELLFCGEESGYSYTARLWPDGMITHLKAKMAK